MSRFVLGVIVTLGLSEVGGPARGGERNLPTGDGYDVRAIAFSPDGKFLVTGHGIHTPSLLARGHVKFWNVKSGKQLARVRVRNGPAEGIAFSPDGTTFAAAAGSLKVWDVQSRKLLREFSRKYRTLDLAYAADGKALATCPTGDDFKGARIWDPATGKCLAELRGHKGTVVSVSFSADGKMLATSSYDDERVILWDTATWKKNKVLRVGVEGTRVLYSPAESLLFVSGFYDKPPALWDLAKGTKKLTFKSSWSRMPPSHLMESPSRLWTQTAY